MREGTGALVTRKNVLEETLDVVHARSVCVCVCVLWSGVVWMRDVLGVTESLYGKRDEPRVKNLSLGSKTLVFS